MLVDGKGRGSGGDTACGDCGGGSGGKRRMRVW